MKLTVSGLLVLAVFNASAGHFAKIGILGGFHLPLNTAASSWYDSGFLIEPFIEFEFTEHLSLGVSGGVSTLDDEDNWWSELHGNSSTDYNANEKSITVSFNTVQGNTIISFGIPFGGE